MQNTKEEFGGNKKVDHVSLLSVPEKKFITWATPKIPKSIGTHHLTYSTLVWSGLIILFGFLAADNINWLWGTSIMIFLQWLTDSLDGAVGRYRNTGLIKWGYYMDHYLDYVFLCSILIGYSFVIKDTYNILFFLLVTFGAFMVNSYLSFAATNKFKITYLRIGPTEVRLLFIIINILFIFFNKTYLAQTLPYVLIASLIGLNYIVYKTQKELWAEDMKNKK
jgi:archaetidylinositol phosphate synthase